jgi:hypothetical protein
MRTPGSVRVGGLVASGVAGSNCRRVEELGEAKVEDFHVAVWPQHHVFRFDVAVSDPARVRRRQSTRDLARNPHRLTDRHDAAVEPHSQRLTLDKLADDEGRASSSPKSWITRIFG